VGQVQGKRQIAATVMMQRVSVEISQKSASAKLACEGEALMIGEDALLVKTLRLDIVDGVKGFDTQRDGVAKMRRC